jgi:hypothetical protein
MIASVRSNALKIKIRRSNTMSIEVVAVDCGPQNIIVRVGD